MRVTIIAAVAENGVIGRDGKLPWRLSNDLRRFKRLTMGHTIVMGRRTWESIGRPLPGRRTIVVSRQPRYRTEAEGVDVASSLMEALRIAESAGEVEAFIIGGAELYREAFPIIDQLQLTYVKTNVDGDTYFPEFEINWDHWVPLESESHEADKENDYPHEFVTLLRCERK